MGRQGRKEDHLDVLFHENPGNFHYLLLKKLTGGSSPVYLKLLRGYSASISRFLFLDHVYMKINISEIIKRLFLKYCDFHK